MADSQEKKTWYVQKAGWVIDRHREVNETVEATKDEAKYLTLAGNIGPEKVDKRKTASPSSPSSAPDTPTTSETPASRALAEKTKA